MEPKKKWLVGWDKNQANVGPQEPRETLRMGPSAQ